MQKVIPKIKEFPNDNPIWRINWLGGVELNHQIPTKPKIQLIIGPLLYDVTDYAASCVINHEQRRSISIGVGQLPLVTIGSLWQDRRFLK